MENLQKFEEFDFKAAWKAGRGKGKTAQREPDEAKMAHDQYMDSVEKQSEAPKSYEDQALFDKIDAKIRAHFHLDNCKFVYDDDSEVNAYDYYFPERGSMVDRIRINEKGRIGILNNGWFDWFDCDKEKSISLYEFLKNTMQEAKDKKRKNFKSDFATRLEERKRYRR